MVILFGLPLAFGGAILATFLFHYTINVFSMIGMILLVGLAIKNGILLVDRTNQNRARGMDRRAALLEAGPARLRAILMTSLTIAASLTPTAFQLGEGADLRAPLAATGYDTVIASLDCGANCWRTCARSAGGRSRLCPEGWSLSRPSSWPATS